MNFLIELIIVAVVIAFIFFISRIDTEDRYEYVEEKDEDGNIIEKVIDHKDRIED